MYHVYILYSSSRDRYYIGSSGNIVDRLRRHQAGRSRSTQSGRPWRLVHVEVYATRSEAYRRERAIKAKKSRAYLIQLMEA